MFIKTKKLSIFFLLLFEFFPAQKLSPAVFSGSYISGKYPDLFEELLGKSQLEVKSKINKAVNQLFYGNDSTQRVYYPVGKDKAYIEDINNNDIRTEGMSYGMMITVQLDMKNEFDRILDLGHYVYAE